MGQTGGGQPAAGIPEITFIDFPKLIPSDGTQILGTVGFRDPDSDIVAVEFSVIQAVTFSAFAFDPHVKGKVDGIFQFLIFSELGQQVTLQAVLKDEQGNTSSPKQFSFVAGRLIHPQIAFLAQWGSFGVDAGEFDLPRAVAVDGEGNIYVADTGNHRVQKFSPTLQLLAQWGSFCDLLSGNGCIDSDDSGPLQLGDGQFNLPQGIAVDASGSVYVVDFGNARVQKFDSDGRLLLQWGGRGNAAGQLNQPVGIAVDEQGHIYVSDVGNERVQKFDSDGGFLLEWGGFGAGNGQFHTPRGLAVDRGGHVYVVDSGNHRVQKFSSRGSFLAKWGTPGTGNGQFFLPFGIALDAAGSVYVADTMNHRLQRFDSEGRFLTQWGEWGQGEGLFNSPTGIAIDTEGNIYIADSVNNRLQKFVVLE
jgi:tripartite motif-containing protein 71